MEAAEPDAQVDSTSVPKPLARRQPSRSGAALWRTITRYEKDKIAPGLALRNSLGILVPLIAGFATGNSGAGLVGSTGALNVSFSDGDDSYHERGRRMLAASTLVGLAVFVGAVSAHNGFFAVFLAAIWAFASGLLVAIGQKPADVGVVSLVTLVVFSAQPMAPERAVYSGLLAFAGGLLQTGLALALWPVRRYHPAKRALGELYGELARAAAAPIKHSAAPLASSQISAAQSALHSLGGVHTVEADRYRALLNQAERVRLSVLTLARLRRRMEREIGGDALVQVLDTFFEIVSGLLGAIKNALLLPSSVTHTGGEAESGHLRQLQEISEHWHETQNSNPFYQDARYQIDALAGQLRAAIELAAHDTPAGSEAFEQREARQPWRLRLRGRVAILRANLSLHSSAFRHAVRLAVCLTAGDTLGRSLNWRRSYWLPMTIAIVLKPDFTGTFSRGVLRLAGTFAGLTLATVLFHILPLSTALQIALIGGFFFVVRCFGPANYGIFVAAISAFVVLLLALTGVAPMQTIAARAVNTAVGGGLALLAYWLWPTWERTQIGDTLAFLLDAYRDYFRAVCHDYLYSEEARDRTRQAGRLARSNLEASVDRLSGEPGVSQATIDRLTSMLASSHRLIHSFMALEAGLSSGSGVPIQKASTGSTPFLDFAHDVERILYYLAAGLRGSKRSLDALPDLRASHRRLVLSAESPAPDHNLIYVETDRLTNSLDTLGEQIVAWIDLKDA